MAARAEFPRVFTELKKLFRPFARRFTVIANKNRFQHFQKEKWV